MSIRFREIEEKDNAAITALIRSTLEKFELDIPGTVYFDKGLDHLSDVYGSEDSAFPRPRTVPLKGMNQVGR